ncbi:MAG: radical SAM protein [Bacillota bacterium]
MPYNLPLYRPPSEAESLILQITIGCSHNKCTFCSMYKTKSFKVLSEDELTRHITWAHSQYPSARRIFLADGDALTINTDRLIKIIESLYKRFPKLERITAYAGPQNIIDKSHTELKSLNAAGLKMLYIGVESGSNQVLKNIAKGTTAQDMAAACSKAKEAGFKLSCTIISGLGGQQLWQEHAAATAEIVNEIDPDYLGMLTLLVEENAPLFKQIKKGLFKLLGPEEILEEIKLMLSGFNLTNCIFRSNHPSNYLSLKGILNKDKERLLMELSKAQKLGQQVLRPEEFRGL